MTWLKWMVAGVAGVAVAVVLVFIGMLSLGGPKQPAVFPGLTEAFRGVDYSGLPPLSHYNGDRGARLAYRYYPAAPGAAGQGAGQAAPRGAVVLAHGSSAMSASMHPLARALAAAGHPAYTLDIRGHGDSGSRGHIDYIGQLEADLVAFMAEARPVGPATLIGYSSGGGFALRVAAGPQASLFQSYLLLAPFISSMAPTQRPDGGGWVSVGVPRIIALTMLNNLGVTAANGLPVARFAIHPDNRARLTETYDYNLLRNYSPEWRWEESIRALRRPVMVLAGVDEDILIASAYDAVFKEAPGLRGVKLLPGINHAMLTLDPRAIAAIVAATDSLQALAQTGTAR